MLRCGATWKPSEIKRVIDTFPSSTRVVQVVTDDGIGFLKGMGNPQGNQSLACELVGSELAAWFGLDTLEFSLIQVSAEDILPLHGEGRNVEPGLAFISKYIEGGTWDGGDVYLSKMILPENVSKLVIFDTWIMNADRYPPEDSFIPIPANRDNILFECQKRNKFKLIAYDHTHCFVEGDIWEELGDPKLICDERIYGEFPEFSPYIKREAIVSALNKLRQLDRKTVQRIVTTVPREWGITDRLVNEWVDLIYKRSIFVADTIAAKLLTQGELGI
ncbi:HipA family kinase [Magnetovibrio blakemorei]|uniref:HipA-like kinase domain-containing protein n=1 Tax=Magnetovibrio blakemorei TaxID=28181 RepID=A0A1E5Q484_9PROT|nr:HipA family kinase [Magnetovibrio blakemorei]OEJ64557.1 hypothetical protein BEN30_16140 [Magnetovibrio blakemorei]